MAGEELHDLARRGLAWGTRVYNVRPNQARYTRGKRTTIQKEKAIHKRRWEGCLLSTSHPTFIKKHQRAVQPRLVSTDPFSIISEGRRFGDMRRSRQRARCEPNKTRSCRGNQLLASSRACYLSSKPPEFPPENPHNDGSFELKLDSSLHTKGKMRSLSDHRDH